MKIIFVGPSLPNAAALAAPGIEIRPPAIQGDVLNAVRSGATSIGIIDGNFEYTAPVWHKEILFALSSGIRVYGAASMGALRAAECMAFGMVGIGEIYEGYASGKLVDDADVALLHGPSEMGWMPLTVPMVNVAATLSRLRQDEAIDEGQFIALHSAASDIFYKNRTWATIVRAADLPGGTDRPELQKLLRSGTVDVKASDARLLLERIALDALECTQTPADWAFAATSMWNSMASQQLQ
jgi:hypothetical protein